MKKILIADDQFVIAKNLSELLTSAGYSVVLASDGEMAIQIALREVPDLIIIDIVMPRKSGIDAVKEIRLIDNIKDTKIIFIATKGQDEDEDKARELGGNSLMYKPISPKKLLEEVEHIIGLSKGH